MCIAIAAGCDQDPQELILVTPASPVDQAIVKDLGELFDSERVRTRVRLTEEALPGEAALNALIAGQADIALISNNFEYRRDVATVMPLYPTVLHIAGGTGIDGLFASERLRNATIFAGPEGSASRRVFERIVKRKGISADEYRYVTDPAKMADVTIVFGPIAPERVAEFPGLVLSSLGTLEDVGAGGVIDAAVLLNPHFRPFVIPVGTYGDATPEPIVTIAVDKILVARSNLDSSVVYDLINDILRLRPALAAKHPGLFQSFDDDFDAGRSRFILHAGTQDYLQRDAPSVYERYSGIAEVVATLFVGLLSAMFAGVRIYKVRRKNRIDTFYSKARELRRSVTDSTSAEDRQRVIDDVRKLQSTAFDMLVDEKLAADESFRIFITLSNDVLRQLGAPGAGNGLSDA